MKDEGNMYPRVDEKGIRCGKDFIVRLYILIKTSLLHEPGNVALVLPLERLLETMGLLLRWEGSFSLKVVGDHLFMDDSKIKVDIEAFQACMFLMEEMKKREKLKLEEEIKSADDFKDAKYLQQPEYNFHKEALQIRNLLATLKSIFISNALS